MAENDPEFLRNNRSMPTLTWIGHSTLLLQFEGLNILTDPHLTRRASPVSFAGPEWYVKPGISIEDLPHIDLIVISHNHYDHLDRLTLEKIHQKQKWQPPRIFVPLNQKEWFDDLEIPSVVEMDWWEEQKYLEWKIHALPVQH
ncbi:MAG: MBL fold metallo-hydrolase [bacterium]